MAQSATMKVQLREKLGSRAARALRAEGRIPANLQSKDAAHLDFSFEEHEFLAARRRHVHLYDLDFGDSTESAVVRELEWDTFGERIIHVEFKRVTRGVATESDVPLAFTGKALGIVNQLVQHVAIRSIPSLIPDNLEVKVGGLEVGTSLTAADIELPEGVELIDPEIDIATIVGASAAPREAEDEEEAEGTEGTEGAAPPAED